MRWHERVRRRGGRGVTLVGAGSRSRRRGAVGLRVTGKLNALQCDGMPLRAIVLARRDIVPQLASRRRRGLPAPWSRQRCCRGSGGIALRRSGLRRRCSVRGWVLAWLGKHGPAACVAVSVVRSGNRPASRAGAHENGPSAHPNVQVGTQASAYRSPTPEGEPMVQPGPQHSPMRRTGRPGGPRGRGRRGLGQPSGTRRTRASLGAAQKGRQRS